MVQGGLRRNATGWVVLQHLIQQVNSAGIQGGHQTGQSSTWWWIGWKLIGRIIWQLDNTRIILSRYRGSQQSKDAIQLIRFRSSSYQGSTRITKEDGWSNEQETTAQHLAQTTPNLCPYVHTTQPNIGTFLRPFLFLPSICHFGKDTSYTPNIDGCRIFATSQQDVRCSIPQGDDFVRITSDRNPKSPGQSKIGQFQLSFSINQQVRRFQIPVQHSMVMAIGNACQELVQEIFQNGQSKPLSHTSKYFFKS
jgi:hypothetical protein